MPAFAQELAAPASPPRIRFFARFDELPAAALRIVESQVGPAWSLAVLRAQDHHPATSVEALCYVVAYQGERLVGWVATAVVPLFDAGLTRGVRLRALSLGDGIGYCVPAIVVAPDHPEPARIHEAILRAAIDHARALALDGVFLYTVPCDQGDLRSALDRLGFFRWSVPPCAFVPLLTERFGRYPGGLRSSYRSVLKKKQRELDALGLRITAGPANLDAASLHALYLCVAAKKESEWAELSVLEPHLTVGFFAAALTDPAFRFHAVTSASGEVLAYNLSAYSGTLLQSLVVGMDREALQRLGGDALAPAVYQMLHFSVLSAAEAEGCRWANLGITAEEGKARLGALFRPAEEADFALTPAFAELLERFSAAYQVPPSSQCHPYGDAALANIRAAAAGLMLKTGDSEPVRRSG